MSASQDTPAANNVADDFSTETHHAVSAWFMGPRAENSDVMKKLLGEVVDRVTRDRVEYFPGDPAFITASTRDSAPYKREVDDLQRYVTLLADLMSRYSLPFFSPRYMGHMCFDNSLPATLGYLTAMIHNPNNVAVEASPLTSYVEYCVGQQLCKMLGYRTTEDIASEGTKSTYKGWGHLTCDGSVANLESLW
ncbi:uncharacterized protein B0H18DRAFT_1167784 [Fomitopsis serialis]|uniref:uncharacterized protein n=1 Tax=Fomitopsis serialis TaxID=139415 RepID=UPI002008C5B3|nr:uncharacterized protein B0H18DRAFT_1167784 [Neoantrodia serialis]KAH9926129.1 hypothetical protein B0H18DRAFT_1167784 [Neoantrodia serialis]